MPDAHGVPHPERYQPVSQQPGGGEYLPLGIAQAERLYLRVEQNAKMALAISDRAYVLETGNISIEGNAADLLNDPRVKKAYLGQ